MLTDSNGISRVVRFFGGYQSDLYGKLRRAGRGVRGRNGGLAFLDTLGFAGGLTDGGDCRSAGGPSDTGSDFCRGAFFSVRDSNQGCFELQFLSEINLSIFLRFNDEFVGDLIIDLKGRGGRDCLGCTLRRMGCRDGNRSAPDTLG